MLSTTSDEVQVGQIHQTNVKSVTTGTQLVTQGILHFWKMLDSVLKSFDTKQEHLSVPEEPRTFAEHQENLKKHIFIMCRGKRLDSLRRVYWVTVPHRELKGHKTSMESVSGWPGFESLCQLWDLPQATLSFLKFHSFSCRTRGTVISPSQRGREDRMSRTKHLQAMQHLTPGKWDGGNKCELLSSTSLSCGTRTWHSLRPYSGCGTVVF